MHNTPSCTRCTCAILYNITCREREGHAAVDIAFVIKMHCFMRTQYLPVPTHSHACTYILEPCVDGTRTALTGGPLWMVMAVPLHTHRDLCPVQSLMMVADHGSALCSERHTKRE